MINALIDMSRRYGSNPDFVLAGGGNTSCKDDQVLTVKASGFALSEIDQSGFVRLDRHKLKKMWRKTYSQDTTKREDEVLKDLMDSRLPNENLRPSVESQLHDLLSGRFVLHLHPALINGLTCAKQGSIWTRQLFADHVLWIEATKPGYILAQTCKARLDAHEKMTGVRPQVILLENHGVFFSADTVEDIDKQVAHMMEVIGRVAKKSADLRPLVSNPESAAECVREIKTIMADKHVLFQTNQAIKDIVGHPDHAHDIMTAVTPDHVVYCRHHPLWATCQTIKKEIQNYQAMYGFDPRIILVEDVGMVVVGDTLKQAENALNLFLDQIRIVAFASSFGGIKPMTDEDIAFILNWEVEHYRIKVGKS
ncbi:MAG: class II aldolase/adducin family protein [Acholeplasmataceae bacterium]|nr:class II aldolase/adducin family protein [Acholeplasmataceae bacterium]